MIKKEIIQRFFQQQCNAEEAIVVSRYLDENPEVINEYLSESEWGAFTTSNNLPDFKSAELWNNITKSTQKQRTIIYHIKRLSIAASVILVVGLSWYFLQNKNNTNNIVGTERQPQQKISINNGSVKMILHLSDGSVAELMPNSSLSYPDTFTTNKRDVILKGEAYFTVAKDKTKPFTVYSGSLSTTVLGTHFNIKSFEKEKSIQITLYEGKVVIKSVDTINKAISKDIYLNPGEVLLYNKETMLATVSRYENNGPKVSSKRQASKNKQSGAISSDNWYMFNNQSLASVFDQLQQIYNVKISYTKADIKKMTFIGKLDKSDSLENILNSIALLNNLHVVKHDGGYFINKKP